MNAPLHPSLWAPELPALEAPPLSENLDTECCIVGAGISGMTAAYLLAREGKPVVVLDAGPLGGGETSHTTAHLSNAIDARYFEMIRIHGLENAHRIAESHTAAINQIERIVEEEKIECDFARVDGYLFAPGPEGEEEIEREWYAARRAGLGRVEKLDRAPLPGFETGPALLFPRQGRFHPLKYLRGLRAALRRDGGLLFGHTPVQRVEGGERAVVTTLDGRTVHARHVIVATNRPVNDRFEIHGKQAACRTYALAAEVPAGSVKDVLLWDTEEPYHYVRLQPGGGGSDFLIVGGEDHRTGQADDAPERYERLERWARERFPMILGIPRRWSGQVVETIDGIAFIGSNPLDAENVTIATGDCGMGMTHGTLAGMILSDRILGRPNRWTALYAPSRKRAGALGAFTREALNVAAQYADYLKPGDVSSETDIAPGSGAVVRHGLKKIALYRDETGICHALSPVCPHLKCIVHWNSEDRTWDCPCHGSRFAATGEVLEGPATSNLLPVEEPAAV